MHIEVHLFANLADYLPPERRGATERVELPEGATLGDLLRELRVPPELPGLLFVNGQDAAPGHRLQSGDVVSILPPLAGGHDPFP